VLGRVEAADLEDDPAERAALLTFAVVGGGFGGVEAVAELRDVVHRVLRFFPALEPGDLRFVLVHAGARVLPELGPELAAFAQTHLRSRGVQILLDTRVARAREDALELEEGSEIRTRTIVWTAGNRPSPLVGDLPLERSRPGALRVDRTLRVPGGEPVWAAGDCAAVPDGDGGTHPPTAQHALREGRALADNLAAVLSGAEPEPLHFRTLGTLAALGQRSGVAEIRGVRFSGAIAWALWRAVYLVKLPGLEKRVRVGLDWLLDIAFPRDIVLRDRPEPHAQEPAPDLVRDGRDVA
jgi:NADH dehydrogenase